jgi:hypothetical protein
MSLPATDTFTRADGGLGANWTDQNATTLAIDTNKVKANGSAFSYAFWNADSFANDQYSQAALGQAGFATSVQYTGVTVRAASTGGSFSNYFLYCDIGSCYLFKTVGGSGALLQTIGGAAAVEDVHKITVEGTTLKAYRNGVQIGTDQTDSGLASGSAGIGGFDTAARMDNWEGGNLGGGAAVRGRQAYHVRQAVKRAAYF